MFRRSLWVLLLLPILGLAMILAYAVWNQRATQQAIVDAKQLLARGATREAIGLLNHADRSLGPRGNPEQRREILKLRYRANQEVGNHAQALRDLSLLLGEFTWPDASERRRLALDKVQLLLDDAIESDPMKLGAALQEALECLAHHPGDASSLELAGLAVQAVYERDLLTLLVDDLPTKLPRTALQLVRRSLPRILYRPAGDALANRLRRELDVELRLDVVSTTADGITASIEAIRARIQESLGYYRQALKADEPAWSALRSYLSALLHGERLDEAAVLSYLYHLRFPKDARGVGAAAVRIEVWLRLGQPERAMEAARHWLAGRKIGAILEEQEMTPALLEFCRNYGRAAHVTGKAGELGDLAAAMTRHEQRRPRLRFDIYYVRALHADLSNDAKGLEWFLGEFCRQERSKAAPASGEDLYTTALRMRLRWARKAGDGQLERRILDEWARDRPTDPLPLIERCEYYLGQDELAAASRDAESALELRDPPELRERALQLLLQSREAQHSRGGSNEGAAGMLAQLRAQGLEVPRTIPHPVMHVGIAKLALEEKEPAIAIANLRVALDKFVWSRHVRLLLARAMLAAERPDDCLHYVHEVLGKDPTDLEALELEYAAETSRGRRLSPGSRVEFLRSHPERREAVFGFLEHLVARSAHDLALKVIDRHRALLADRPAVRLLEARAHLGLLGYAKALAALEAIPPEATEYAEAISLAVETAAVVGDKTRLALLITRLTRCEAVTGDTLLRVAATLTERGHVSEALDVLRPVETDARRKEWRNGRFYTLLGRLRHAGGRVTEAQDQWNAAFSFPDGEEAGPLLAISHLLRNDEPAAREMLGYVAEPVGDPLLLAWLYQATGDGKRALALLKRFETESPLLRTLLTQALESVIEPGKPPSVTTFDPFLNRIVKAQPKRVFDCLALSRGMAFTAEAGRAHTALVAAFPGTDAWTQAALQTLHAFQDWLAGRELDAARTLLSVTRDSPLYYAAYDPLIALTENIAPDSLMQQDMIVRYMSLVVLGPDELRKHGSQVPTMLFRGLAHAANKNGDFGQAANFLRLAHGLDPSDVTVLTLMVEDARRRGDLDAALDLQLEAITWQGNAPTASSMRSAADLALIALERPEASKPETPLGTKVRKMLDLGRRYQESATEAERPPLGAIALLEVRLLAPAAGGVGPQNAAAVALLERFLQPYLLGSLPVHADLAGLQRVIAEMVARDHAPAALRHLRTLLERDPSLLELWLQRARLLETVGDNQGAVDHLAWSVHVLPDPEALGELARLMGLNPGIRPELRGDVLAAIESCGTDSPELRAGRGLLELRLGRLEAAFASFEAASKVRLGPAETWLRDATLLAVEPEAHRSEVLARMRALNADPARCPYPATEDIIHQLEHLERGAKTPGAPPSNK